MIRPLLLAALLAALLVVGGPARAASSTTACDLRLVNVHTVTYRGASARGYDPYSSANGVTMVEFGLSNSSTEGCAYAIGFSTGASGSYERRASGPSGSLRYNVYASPSAGAEPLRDVPEATSSTLIEGTIAGKQTNKTFRFYVDVPARQNAGPGTYADQLKVSVYTMSSGTPSVPEDSADFAVQIPVPAVVNVQIQAGGVRVPLAGASLSIDFGNLEPHERRHFDLFVQGNTPYRVEVVSQNAGKLVLDEQARDHNTIPYSLAIDGANRSLTAPAELSFGSVGQGTRHHQATITIGSFDAVLRGTYSDVLTITVSAN